MRKKEKGRNFIFSLLFVLIIFLLFLNMRILTKREDIEERVKNLKREIENLGQKKKELEETLLKAKTEFFWEEKAREQGFIKEGEEPIIIQFK